MNSRTLKELNASLSNLYTNQNLTWKQSYLQTFPKKFIKYKDLLLLPCSAFSDDCWKCIDQKQLLECIAKIFQVTRIAIQGRIQSDDHRTPNVEMLLGDNSIVTQVDNKIRYTFDLRKCMFSSGNITEKIRMSKLQCHNEVIVDMFAGIGYFTIPLIVHAKAKLVHACEWNENAVAALRINLQQNNASAGCVVHSGDNRKVAPVGVADRILLGLIPSARASFRAACRSLNSHSGGILHIHENVSSKATESDNETDDLDVSKMTCNRKIKPNWKTWAVKTATEIKNLLTALSVEKLDSETESWIVQPMHVERVKSYAPHIDHLVLDLRCTPLRCK